MLLNLYSRSWFNCFGGKRIVCDSKLGEAYFEFFRCWRFRFIAFHLRLSVLLASLFPLLFFFLLHFRFWGSGSCDYVKVGHILTLALWYNLRWKNAILIGLSRQFTLTIALIFVSLHDTIGIWFFFFLCRGYPRSSKQHFLRERLPVQIHEFLKDFIPHFPINRKDLRLLS